MGMKDIELFQAALDLSDPWFVSASVFDGKAKTLSLKLDFPPGSTFCCPECGAENCQVYDTKEMTWRHMNFWQYETYIDHFKKNATNFNNYVEIYHYMITI